MCTGRSLTVCQGLLPGGAKTNEKCKKMQKKMQKKEKNAKKILGGRLILGGVPAPRGCACSRGVSAPGGCLLPGDWGWGVCSGGSAPGGSAPGSAPRGCLLWEVCSWRCAPGVSALGGVCSGGCLLWGGCVCSWGCVASQHALKQTPPCGQNHRRLWKHYLGPTSLRPVIIWKTRMKHIRRFRLSVIRHFAFINTDQRQGKGKSKVLCYTLQIYVFGNLFYAWIKVSKTK